MRRSEKEEKEGFGEEGKRGTLENEGALALVERVHSSRAHSREEEGRTAELKLGAFITLKKAHFPMRAVCIKC